VQDSTACGLASYVVRTMVEDHSCGRLTFYEILARHAGEGDWQSFMLGVLEYTEASGYDTSSLFEMVQEES
jgi:hypothetical protein